MRRELVGRTKFCVRAGAAAERISVIGGTKRIHLDRVEQLKPDLVIASKEENSREDVEACRAFTDVLVTDVRTIPDAFEALETIGEAIEQATAGISWRSNIEKSMGRAARAYAGTLCHLAKSAHGCRPRHVHSRGDELVGHWQRGASHGGGAIPNCTQSAWMH